MKPIGTTHIHMRKQDLIRHIINILGVGTRVVLVERGLRKMSRIDLVNLCSAIKTKLNEGKLIQLTQPPRLGNH